MNIPPQSLASALEVLARSPSRMRLGVARGYFFTNLDPTLEGVIAKALRHLRDRGVVLVEADIPDLAGLTSDGLPVGLELDGPAGSDRTLLAMGLAMEEVLGPLPPQARGLSAVTPKLIQAMNEEKANADKHSDIIGRP